MGWSSGQRRPPGRRQHSPRGKVPTRPKGNRSRAAAVFNRHSAPPPAAASLAAVGAGAPKWGVRLWEPMWMRCGAGACGRGSCASLARSRRTRARRRNSWRWPRRWRPRSAPPASQKPRSASPRRPTEKVSAGNPERPGSVRRSAPRDHELERYTEKYFACGCRMTSALVDCSGWSWSPSPSDTPMRSAPKISKSLRWSPRFGHAG